MPREWDAKGVKHRTREAWEMMWNMLVPGWEDTLGSHWVVIGDPPHLCL